MLEIRAVTIHNHSEITKLLQSHASNPTIVPEASANGDADSASTEILVPTPTSQSLPEGCAQNGLITVLLRAAGQCTQDCSCRCHTSRKQARSSSWLRSAIGSFMLEYDISAITKPWKCDRPGCQRSRSSTSFECNFPSWLYHYYRGFRMSIGSMGGYGAHLHLLISRQAPYYGELLDFLYGEMDFQRLEIHLEAGALYYPSDHVPTFGEPMMNVSAFSWCYSTSECC